MARKHSKNVTDNHLKWQSKQCTREQESKVDGMEERALVGVYRSTSPAARVKKERNRAGEGRWFKTLGKKGGKGQEKGGKGDTIVCWKRGSTEHIAANCNEEKLELELERCRPKTKGA